MMNISKGLLSGSFQPEDLRYCYHHGKTGQQKQAESIQAQDTAQQQKLTGAAQGTLGQFEGPVQQSPFYKALLTSGIESTSRAYDNARANMRQRANMAGFGYNQPVEQGAEDQLGAQEATSLAAVPREATVATAPLALQAAGQTGSMGMGYGAQGLEANQQAANLQSKRGSLFKDLLNVGQMASGAVAPWIRGGQPASAQT